jgi:predicted kinase
MKLILIRGNSGSGKSTLALSLRKRLAKDGIKTALISQDYFRRIVLKEKDRVDKNDILQLLDTNIRLLIEMGYVVILEGILSSEKYGPTLLKLNHDFGEKNCKFFYYDVSFEETLKRHKTKPNSHEFGEKDMREWWIENDRLNLSNEFIINEEMNHLDSIEFIKSKLL